MSKFEVDLDATFRKRVYVEAGTLEEAEEIAQEVPFDETWKLFGVDFDVTAWPLSRWPKDATTIYKSDGEMIRR
jgi:hypothetical protein